MDPRWFHLTTHTYAAWLPGDPRGFRTRRHREHVDGDYRHPPPPGTHAARHARSKRLLKQAPVRLAPEWRAVVGAAVREKLAALGAQVLCVSMGATHLHALAKLPPGPVPRLWLGRAKMHATFEAHAKGFEGKVWATGSKVTPVKDRDHQLNAFRYILRHIQEGAWVWDFREEQDPDSTNTPTPPPPESPGTAVPGLSPPSDL